MIQFKVLSIDKAPEPDQTVSVEILVIWLFFITGSLASFYLLYISAKILKQKLRDKRNLINFLNNIEGLKLFKKELVKRFRNVENLRKALKEEIAQIVGKKLAKNLFIFS